MTTMKKHATIAPPLFPWQEVDTVLLDMDGTLLDKHFDDYFWEQYVPEHYSLLHDMPVAQAKKKLLATYQQVENTLDWTDLDYWSRQLGLDIPDLKIRVNHLIAVHPYVIDFLKFVKRLDKKLYLVTNAHSKTLDIKLRKTAIGDHFDRIICAEQVGMPKESPAFWDELAKIIPYDKKRCLLADDTKKVLFSARESGLKYLVFVARPSSKQPMKHADDFISIEYFNELMRLDQGERALPSG